MNIWLKCDTNEHGHNIAFHRCMPTSKMVRDNTIALKGTFAIKQRCNDGNDGKENIVLKHFSWSYKMANGMHLASVFHSIEYKTYT